MNLFPSRVSESLDSMDAFHNSSSYHQSHESLGFFSPVGKVKGFARNPCNDVDGVGGNFNLELGLNTLGNNLDCKKNFELEAVKLSNGTPLENHQCFKLSLLQSIQNELVGINLEADECVKESTPSSSESDVAANVFSRNMDVEGKEVCKLGQPSYFPDFQEAFDKLVYPKGDPDAVTLSKKDVDLLQPDTCINDNIIDFYILYLKNKIRETEKARFHFFNSFFFRKLTDMDKNPPNACDGKSAFLHVRRWTRKVNLFEKDYIFIPVNFNNHWSLLVICYPGELVSINDKEPEKSLRLPCILHMDSIKGHHSGLKDLVQSYLCEEWKERNKDTCGEDLSSRFLNMRFIPVAVPQQENSFDCGLFLLHYLELFLAQSPFNFNPLILNKFSKFLNLDWFPPVEPYFKRPLIRRLIFNLVENHGHHCSEYNDNKIGGQSHLINGEASTSHAGRGIEMAPSFDTSRKVLKEYFEPGTALGFSVRHCQSFDQRSSNHCFNGSMFTVEDTDFSAHLQAEHANAKSSLDTSICASDDSDVKMIENLPVKKKSKPYLMSIENLQHLQHVNDSAATINVPVKKESKSFWMSVENLRSLQDMNDSAAAVNLPDLNGSAATVNLPDLNDSAEIIETFPVKNESRDGRGENCKSMEKLEHLPDMNDSAATLNLPVKKESTYWMSIDNIRHLQKKNDSAAAAAISSPEVNGSDDLAIIQNFPIKKESRSSLGREETNCTSVGNLTHLPDMNYSPSTINFPVMDYSQHLNMMCANNMHWYQHLSPTQLLHHVSNAVDNKVIDDDVQITNNMNLELWNERPAKKRRLMT